jgi:hypothetical protein
MKQLDFSTGVQEYTLNGRVNVSFNPTDVVFLERLTQTLEKLDALQEELNAARGSLSEADIFPFAKEQDKKMRAVLDALFDVPVCEALFGSMNLYASAGGFPVWANLILAVYEEVETAMQGELTAREQRIAKYVDKYRK